MEKKFEFEKFNVYQKAIDFVNNIYRVTNNFPRSEQYCLINQIKRSTTSIALNIAEGFGRYHKKEKIQFYNIARSSAHECIAILTISLHQKYFEKNEYDKLYEDCYDLSRMISGLINSIEKRSD